MRNNVTTRGTPTNRDLDFAHYDALPAWTRQMLQETAFNMNSEWAQAILRHNAGRVEDFRRHVKNAEHEEIDNFSNAHRRRLGMPSPHAAAAVSVQRYHGRRGAWLHWTAL